MPGEAIWFEICPCCNGKGKISEITSIYKDATFKNERAGLTEICLLCEGKGKIVICRKKGRL